MEEILITQSLYWPNTYYIFRPINENQYNEVELVIDLQNQLVKCSQLLKVDEMNYIRENIFSAKFERFQSLINDKVKSYESIKSTYLTHE